MTESQFTQAVLRELRRELPRAVIFKHADRFTRGVPDLSITQGGRTWWVEVKVGKLAPSAIQAVTMAKLGEEGRALYLVRHSNGLASGLAPGAPSSLSSTEFSCLGKPKNVAVALALHLRRNP